MELERQNNQPITTPVNDDDQGGTISPSPPPGVCQEARRMIEQWTRATRGYGIRLGYGPSLGYQPTERQLWTDDVDRIEQVLCRLVQMREDGPARLKGLHLRYASELTVVEQAKVLHMRTSRYQAWVTETEAMVAGLLDNSATGLA